MKLLSLFYAFFFFIAVQTLFSQPEKILLNGQWLTGINRQYDKHVEVPGLASDPETMEEGVRWYKKELTLPQGQWSRATLLLKGARFAPEVYVDGVKVSSAEGGMAPTYHVLDHNSVAPGQKVTLEIALQSLKNLSTDDASYIPPADHWRSNISSFLWDDVVLLIHGDGRLKRYIPHTNIDSGTLQVDFLTEWPGQIPDEYTIEVTLKDQKEKSRGTAHTKLSGENKGAVTLEYDSNCELWSSEHPVLYELNILLKINGKVVDQKSFPYGLKSFSLTKDRHHFLWNNNPVTLRAGSVVWHRWVRDEPQHHLSWDTAWFRKNVIRRLKDHGANTLRFHLGNPPERFLDLCDQHGLMVQYEWSFFHGLPATKESLIKQWSDWIDLAMRHPSVAIIHPYNETHSDELETAWAALDHILKDYPPLVMEERDVMHVHKYWWSLFENVGLYYDSYKQFPKAIMVDEFGGNYLDGNYDPGGYPALKESFLRFLGPNHTREERKYHHTIANAKIAEYWRRIGAAGFSPFCILGSWEDGNHWFEGDIQQGKPKPVWDALTAAWSPQSVSLELWNRNFTKNQQVRLPIHFFNEFGHEDTLTAFFFIKEGNEVIYKDTIKAVMKPYENKIRKIYVKTPNRTGDFRFEVQLFRTPEGVKKDVESWWDIHVTEARVPGNLIEYTFAVPEDESELYHFLKQNRLVATYLNDTTADMILLGQQSWDRIVQEDTDFIDLIEQCIDRGQDILFLDVGKQYLGKGYPDKEGDLGNLQGADQVDDREVVIHSLFKGLQVKSYKVAEPESHIHPASDSTFLWFNLKDDHTWLWNGYRGGLIVPSAEMEVMGLSQKAFIKKWIAKGAERKMIEKGPYFAYELQGFYAFSDQQEDEHVKKQLRNKVHFLVEDAPALKGAVNPDAPIQVKNLAKRYKMAEDGQARDLIPLVKAGKNLSRTPVVKIDLGKNKGAILFSQLLTNGRLAHGFGDVGLYGVRYDETAVQFVLNMMYELK